MLPECYTPVNVTRMEPVTPVFTLRERNKQFLKARGYN